MEDHKLPDALDEFISRIQSLYKPPMRQARRPSISKLSSLPDNLLNLLVEYLNDTKEEECIWLRPNDWVSLIQSESIGYSPLSAQAQFHKRIEHLDGLVSTFTDNPDNSCIYFKNSDGTDAFGRVFSIFSHFRAPAPSQNVTDVWLHVKCFPPLISQYYNPFNFPEHVEVQCALRMWSPTVDKLIKLNDVIAQCTWIMYKAGEMNKYVDVPTIAMIILKR